MLRKITLWPLHLVFKNSLWVSAGIEMRSYFSFQPVLHDWCNKGRGMCYPVCVMVHIKEPLLLIGKSSPCGGSGFPLSLFEWSFTICMTPYNRKYNVLSASLNKTLPSSSFKIRTQYLHAYWAVAWSFRHRVLCLTWCSFILCYKLTPSFVINSIHTCLDVRNRDPTHGGYVKHIIKWSDT